MRRFVRRTIVVALVLFAAIQFVRPATTNPPVDTSRTLAARLTPSHPAASVIARACHDCHSNETTWPWYSRVAPVSWLVAHDVNEARTAVNFSTWADYGAERQRKVLKESCEEVREGEMPLSSYVLIHPDKKVNAADVRAMCDLAQMD